MRQLALLCVAPLPARASRLERRPGDGFEVNTSAPASNCLNGACYPGNEFCGNPFKNAPMFHLMDQHGCGENDPNGPVFDPVHGVVHHFYQIHLAASPGHGPDYGHFVSKDFVNWAALPVAIWNGLEVTKNGIRKTPYDNQAIFTGSAVVVDGAGPGGQPGVVNIYPGLCDKKDWPACGTGTLLAQAVPDDYANDELLTNWSKPSYNPVIENAERDPSTPWKTPSGEWRLRTYNSIVYGAASDADMLAGKWYTIGPSKDFRGCECPSFYPLPAATPGFEAEYGAAAEAAALPTHVHKTSCGGDWWQLGTYDAGPAKSVGTFKATPGWEDLFKQKKIEQGQFYASKDNEYPTKGGGKRRVNWGWATVPPASAQTLPREITFNAAARTLEQAPLAELEGLRGAAVYSKNGVALKANTPASLGLASGVAKQSEIVATFALPSSEATFGVVVGKPTTGGTPVEKLMKGTDMGGGDYNVTHYPPNTDATVCEAACAADVKCNSWTYVIRGNPAGSGDCCLKGNVPCPTPNPICTSGAKVAAKLPGCGSNSAGAACTVQYKPSPDPSAAYHEVPVQCGGKWDTLRIVAGERTVEVRVYADYTFIEAYFQKGRVAMTVSAGLNDDSELALTATAPVVAASVHAYPIKSIWVTPEAVRKAPRVYPK